MSNDFLESVSQRGYGAYIFAIKKDIDEENKNTKCRRSGERL